jgi:hypothetical protein
MEHREDEDACTAMAVRVKDLSPVALSIPALLAEPNPFAGLNELHNSIKHATGLLPEGAKPSLIKLARDWSLMKQAVGIGLSKVAGYVSRIVVMAVGSYERGWLEPRDQRMVHELVTSLNTEGAATMEKFVNQAREDLVKVHEELVSVSVGERVRSLMDRRTGLEEELGAISRPLQQVT